MAPKKKIEVEDQDDPPIDPSAKVIGDKIFGNELPSVLASIPDQERRALVASLVAGTGYRGNENEDAMIERSVRLADKIIAATTAK